MNIETAQIKATLVDKFKPSEYAERVRRRIEEIKSMVTKYVIFICDEANILMPWVVPNISLCCRVKV